MFFSAKFLLKNPLSIQEKLMKDHYRYQSLTPVNPLGVNVIPAKPVMAFLQKEGKNVILSWQKQENNSLFVIYRFKLLQRKKTDNPDKILYVTSYNKLLLGAAKGYRPSRYKYVVTSLSPSHTESDPVKVKKN